MYLFSDSLTRFLLFEISGIEVFKKSRNTNTSGLKPSSKLPLNSLPSVARLGTVQLLLSKRETQIFRLRTREWLGRAWDEVLHHPPSRENVQHGNGDGQN